MKSWLHLLSYILLWVGGLNWGLVGLFNYNLVESIGLPVGMVQAVYVLVGAAALYAMLTHKMHCKDCEKMMK